MLHKAVMVLVCLTAGSLAGAAPSTHTADQAAEIFQTNRIHTIHLQITNERWQMMQPLMACRLAVLLGAPQHPVPEVREPADENNASTQPVKKAKGVEGKRVSPSPFGYEFAYVRANVEIDGEALRDVGIRFKGNYSFRNAGSSLRRPFKLDFNRFVQGQKFHGLDTVNLHNNTADPSQLREALSYALFREAKVPSPRTAFALVYLSIDRVCNHEFIGLYTLTEEVDKRFLKEHFGSSKGLLLKPEQTRNLPYLGDEWDDYGRYRPKTEASDSTNQRFIEFTRLIHFADDETFLGSIDSYMDTDEFIRFVAVNALLINMDGFLTSAHNYFIYVNPEDGRIYFMPWDLHLSFASAGAARGGDEFANLSIVQPYAMNRLIERVMQRGDLREKYDEYLRQWSRTWFSPAEMNPRIDEMNRAVELANAKFAELGAGNRATTMPVAMPRRPDLKAFVKARVESVLGQLDGRVTGYTPYQRPLPAPARAVVTRPRLFGNRAGANRPAAQARRANRFERQEIDVRNAQQIGAMLLNNLDADRDGQLTEPELVDAVDLFLLAIDCRRSASIDEKELAEGLNRVGRLLDPNVVLAPPPKPQTDVEDAKNPSGGRYWGQPMMKAADADHDGRLTRDELIGALRRVFAAADGNGDRSLNRNEVIAAAESLVGKSPATARPAAREPLFRGLFRRGLGR